MSRVVATCVGPHGLLCSSVAARISGGGRRWRRGGGAGEGGRELGELEGRRRLELEGRLEGPRASPCLRPRLAVSPSMGNGGTSRVQNNFRTTRFGAGGEIQRHAKDMHLKPGLAQKYVCRKHAPNMPQPNPPKFGQSWPNFAEIWPKPDQCWPSFGHAGPKFAHSGPTLTQCGRYFSNVVTLRPKFGQTLVRCGPHWPSFGQICHKWPKLGGSGQISVKK